MIRCFFFAYLESASFIAFASWSGAGGGLHAAGRALKTVNDQLCGHTLHKSTDSFQIAVTATEKLYVP